MLQIVHCRCIFLFAVVLYARRSSPLVADATRKFQDPVIPLNPRIIIHREFAARWQIHRESTATFALFSNLNLRRVSFFLFYDQSGKNAVSELSFDAFLLIENFRKAFFNQFENTLVYL